MKSNPQVTHHPEQGCFRIDINSDQAVLEYEADSSKIVITHTFVPDTLRGRGLAAQLVEAALAFAKASDLQVVSHCSYVSAYMKRHNC